MADTDDFSRALARLLKRAFEESNYSIRSLAQTAGMSPTTLQAYLNGTTGMQVQKARTLSALLGRDFKELVNEVEMSL